MNFSSLVILAQQGDPGGGWVGTLIMFGIILAIFYFLLIRPQKKEMERHQELLSGLKVGDKVVTAGGILGTIKSVDDNIIQLEIDRDTKIKISRDKIQKSQDEFFGSDEDDGDDEDD